MSAKKRKNASPPSNTPPAVDEYCADYREHSTSEEATKPDSLAYQADYREGPDPAAGELPLSQQIEEDSPSKPATDSQEESTTPSYLFSTEEEAPDFYEDVGRVVISEEAHGEEEVAAEPPSYDLVSGGEILAEEDQPDIDEEPSLNKEEARQLSDVVIAAAHPRKKRRRYGIPAGMFVLFLALVGVVFLAVSAGQALYNHLHDDSKLREYDDFLSAVVMQDPAPFENIASADPEMVMTASLWYAISTNGPEHYSSYDAEGRSLIPLGDVTAACLDLFGPDCSLQPAPPEEETFFTFSNEDNQFHVAPYSSQGSYTPYTESVKKSGDSILLRVGYLSPADDFFADSTTEPKPAKHMEYELKTNPETGKLYIFAVRATE